MQIHNPILTGSFTVNGVDVSSITGSLTYSASFASQITSLNATSASILAQTASLNAFSSSLLSYTSSNDAKVSSLNLFSSSILSYTSSTDAKIASIYTTTGSQNTRLGALEASTASLYTTTGSQNTRLGALEAATASLYTATSSFNAFSASILTYTSSLNASVTSLNSYTQSTDAKIASIYSTTSSLNASVAGLNAQTASLLSYTSSNDAKIVSIYSTTSSLNTRVGTLEAYTSSLNNKTSSFATTGSNTFIGTQTISGSILQSGSFTSTGTLTAQTLVVQTITSSVVYSSGSNIFGNAIGNTQTFTGSVLITGSLALAGNITSNGTAVVLGSGTSSYLPKFTGTSTIGNSIVYDDGTSVGVGTVVPLQKFDVTTTAGEVISSTSNRSTNGQYISGIVSAAKNSSAAYLSYAATYGLIESNTAGSESGAYTIWTRKSGTLSEKLRLDASGNLGLGVTPSAWSDSFYKVIEGGDANNQSALAFRTDTNGIELFSNAYFNGTNNIYKYTGIASLYQNTNGIHAWYNAPSGTAGAAITFTQAMTLDANGSLGIGTATMSSGIPLTISAASGLNTNIAFQQNSVNKWYKRNLDSSDDFSFYYAPSSGERLRITSGGNVGIGTTNPAYLLDVNGTGRFSGGVTIKSGNGDQLQLNNAGERFTQINFSNNTVSKANIWWDNTNTELVLLASDSGTGHLKIASTGAATFSSSVTAGGGFISNNDSNTPAGFYKLKPSSVATARWWRITSDNIVYGDFSIAQSSANSDASYTNILYFNAAGAATFSSSVDATKGTFTSAPSLGGEQIRAYSNSGAATSYGGLLVLNSTGKGGYLTSGDNSTTTWYGAQAGYVTLAGTAGAAMKFRVDADDTKGITIATTGAATFSSGIGIGGATATTGGIQFPATAVAIADANNLDDYEEGTWTPTLTTSGGTPPTVVSSSGRYIIIGKLVTIYFKFLLSSASGGSGQLKITNAPFSLNLSTIPAVGFARITDLGLTLNCGFLTGTVINFNKYDGNYAGTDYETVGQVSYYND